MGGKGKRDKAKKQVAHATAAASSASENGGRTNVASHQGGVSSRNTQLMLHQTLTETVIEHEQRVIQDFYALWEAKNHGGVADLKVEAMEIAAASKTVDPSSAASIYMTLGSNHLALKQDEEVIEMWEQSKSIYEQLQNDQIAVNLQTHESRCNRRALGCVCEMLAIGYDKLWYLDKANALHERSMMIAQEMGLEASVDKFYYGSNCRKLGQFVKAVGLLKQAVVRAEEEGDLSKLGTTRNHLALCYQDMGEYEKAIKLYKQSVVIFKENGLSYGLMTVWRGLGECYALLCNYDVAYTHHKKYLQLAGNPDDKDHLTQAMLNFGVTCWIEGLELHHEAMAAADSISELNPSIRGSRNLRERPLRIQKQGTELMSCAELLLTSSLECNVNGTTQPRLDATLNLSCHAFWTGQEAQAVEYLQMYLNLCVELADNQCEGCLQVRAEDKAMLRLKCGGCKIARCVLENVSSLKYFHVGVQLSMGTCRRLIEISVASLRVL